MDQRGGWAATIALLIAALVGASYLPRKAGDVAKALEDQGSPAKIGVAKAGAAAAETLILSCAQIERRLERFYPKGVPIPKDGNCYENGATGLQLEAPRTQPVSFAVAVVPNPVQTHLPLMFDRQIDAIQTAAQDSGFNYDDSWFPWYHSDKSYNSLSDQEEAAQHETQLQTQPGIMVFRRGIADSDSGDPYENGLIIFIVAEQPTGGVSDRQLTHAIQWIEALRSKSTSDPLRIMGPTFSGSLASLYRELTLLEAFSQFPGGIRIFSGTTNADANVNWFRKRLQDQDSRPGLTTEQKLFQFHTYFESDSLMVDRFLCYMQHEGYDLNHFAILSEDQTAFGKAATGAEQQLQDTSNADQQSRRCQDHFGKQEGTPLYLYYPRDIASLRSAYEQQSIFSAGRAQAGGSSTSLKTDLSEPTSSEHDTVRTYAGQLTPQAQEAELFGIANILDSKHIEFVIVRSTNTLDQLFISEFLRRSYPSGRVVLDGSDLMFRRGMQGASLRGVVLLTPYPLLSWTQDSLPTIEGGPSPSHRVFDQDSSEGTYIAARQLLKEVKGAAPSVSISDYAPPPLGTDSYAAPASRRPPTWITVVGHRQFWPLAILNEMSEVNECKPKLFGLIPASADCRPLPYGPTTASLLEPAPVEPAPMRRTGLPGEMWGLIIGCTLLAAWHYYCCSHGSIFRPPRLLAYFSPVPWLQHTVLIFLGSLFVGYLGLSLSFVVLLAFHDLTPGASLGLSFAILLILALPFLGCIRNYLLPVVTGDTDDGRKRLLNRIQAWRVRLAFLWLPTLGALAIIRYYYLTYHLHLANRFPAFWRSVYLRSGVSPLMPQILLILGLYAWFWFNLHGLALFGDDRPVLPRVDDLPQYEVPANKHEEAHAQHTQVIKVFRIFSQEGAGQNIEANGLPLGKKYLKSLVITVPVSFVALWLALGQPALRTLGDRRFGVVIFGFVAVCIGLILADTLQLVNTWSQLRRLLIFLDRLRLRRTLATLHGLYGGSVWKLSGNVLEERYRLISRQFESLRNLQTALSAWTVTNAGDAQRRQLVCDQLALCDQDGRDFVTWYVNLLDDQYTGADKEYNNQALASFQKMLAATAGCVMKLIIMPAWQSESQSLIRASGAKEEAATFEKLVADLPPHLNAAEEFFLLPYMGFIRNILGRVRTLGLAIVTMFVAVTLCVSSYPFDPLPVIGAVFLVLFVVVGVVMVITYAEMMKDATLSRIASTNPGELGLSFWVKMIGLGAGPLLALLTTLFPSMTDFIVSFLQPGAQAIK
jgi:hypothetical protein